MIYLTLDTCIWINSLDEAWKLESQLDILEVLINEGHVKLLTPTIIISEWKKNKDDQVKVRAKKLENFFGMAEEILPSAFFSDYKKQDVQNQIILNQLDRIENILKLSEIIPINDEIEKQVINWGIKKLAPMHKKTSVADAIIIFSIFNFSNKNLGNQFYFISNNTDDFCEKINGKSTNLHKDLQPLFNQFGVRYFNRIEHAFGELQIFNNSDFAFNFDEIRKNRIKNKLKNKLYNPDLEKVVSNQRSSFIVNVDTLKFILKETTPTKEQVIFILALIESDDDYEKAFYEALEYASWFNILKERGVFHPSNNPSPYVEDNNIKVRFWQSLSYLQKISLQIKEGKQLDLISEILDIIKKVSQKPKDNYWTWRCFIEILSNLPNERIEDDILNFIPLWLKDITGNGLQCRELYEKLLPKFLSESPTTNDIKKAEIIIKYLFSIEQDKQHKVDNRSYKSLSSLWSLNELIKDDVIVSRIIKYCSDDIIISIANNLNKLFYDFPDGINLNVSSESGEIKVEAFLEDENIKLKVFNQEEFKGEFNIKNFIDLSEEEIQNEIIVVLSQFATINVNKTNFFGFIDCITNGLHLHDSTKKIKESKRDYNEINDVFSLILFTLINEKVKQKPIDSMSLLELLAFDKRYHLSFFKKIIFYVVTNNWHTSKSVFWKIINQSNRLSFFEHVSFKHDLYDLLNKNQKNLSKEEIEQLHIIIEEELPLVIEEERKNSSLLHWYSALRETPPFDSLYLKYSILEGVTYTEIENQGHGKTYFKIGTISPVQLDEIFKWSDEKIVEYINSFKPKNNWDEPSVDDLSMILKNAVSKEPLRFSKNIHLYQGLPYVYVYRMLNGFEESIRKGDSLDLKQILEFCKDYIKDEGFYLNKFWLNVDDVGVTHEWVVGTIADILSNLLKEKYFDIDLFPIVKEILVVLSSNIENGKKINGDRRDYLSHVINSPSGKVLLALIEYSLCKVRILEGEKDKNKWESDVKILFENTLNLKVGEAYTILGWYNQQFYYLDKEWTINQINNCNFLDEQSWEAFFGGLIFANPSYNTELYHLFYSHFERAITKNIDLSGNINHSGIATHLVAFYFWNFENLDEKALLAQHLKQATIPLIIKLINFLSWQKQYFANPDDEEHNEIWNKVITIWSFLLEQYHDSKDEKKVDLYNSLCNLIGYIHELNERTTEIIISTIENTDKRYKSRYLSIVEQLIILINADNKVENPRLISEILQLFSFDMYLDSDEQKNLAELVTYLYENNENEIANEFCEKHVKEGHHFLKSIYDKYNHR